MDHRVTAQTTASPEEVWRLFVDIERWPELTASMQQVRRTDDGPLRVGSEAVVKQPNLPRSRWKVTELADGSSFTWESKSPGVTTTARHLVEAADEGATITLVFEQRGPLAGLVNALMGGRIRKFVDMELDGFRRGAEAGGGPGEPRPAGGS